MEKMASQYMISSTNYMLSKSQPFLPYLRSRSSLFLQLWSERPKRWQRQLKREELLWEKLLRATTVDGRNAFKNCQLEQPQDSQRELLSPKWQQNTITVSGSNRRYQSGETSLLAVPALSNSPRARVTFEEKKMCFGTCCFFVASRTFLMCSVRLSALCSHRHSLHLTLRMVFLVLALLLRLCLLCHSRDILPHLFCSLSPLCLSFPMGSLESQ